MKKNDGFTLTEVVVTILILSVVVLMIFSFMNAGLDSYLYGVQRTEEQGSLRLTAYRITEEVRNCFEIDIHDVVSDVAGTQYFYVDSNVLYFSDDGTDIPLSQPIIDDVDYAVNNIDGRYTLTIILAGPEDVISTEILLNNISSDDILPNLAGGASSTKILEISTTPN